MTQRLVPVLAGVLATTVVGGVLTGSLVLPLVSVGPIGALLLYAAISGRRSAVAELPWSPPVVAAPVLCTPGSSWQVAAALGRAESRQLAVSPWFGVALGFLAIFLVMFGVVYAGENGDVWHQAAAMTPWFAHPVAGMTILAVHRAVTRPVRDGSDELFKSCPTEPVVRAMGLLRTAIVPVTIFVGFLVVYGVAVVVGSPNLHGPVSINTLPLLLAGPVLVAGAVGLGVALGLWVRFGLAPVVAVVGVGLLSLKLATAGDPGWNGSSALSTFGPDSGSPLLHSLSPTWWYLLWLVALVALVAVVAMARYRLDRPVRLAAAVGVVVAMVAALFGTAGPDAETARHVADLIARPASHQACDRVGALVDVCTYRDYNELHASIVAAVAPVARALPARAQPITLRQGFGGTEGDLPVEVRRLLPAGVPSPGEGEVEIGFASADNALLEYRLLVAFAALGLRLRSDALDHGPLVIAGEARGVVALWLAARGLDPGDAVGLATVEQPGVSDNNLRGGAGSDAFELGLAWPEMCGPVVWAPQDLAAARALMRAPEAEVAAIVDAGFARWSQPTTTTDDLLAALGLPTVGPASRITSRTESHC
ncbi:MAG TPA: hypothetical protein VM938_07960 [Acidimicrobiales bacterium]|nr:hypothetical protein [Acidimicrobiales bacterium]